MQRNLTTWGRRIAAPLLALGLAVGATSCDELLQVSNPSSISGDDILNPAAASALANGALSGVARGYAAILTSYSTATDELEWSGSRDAFQELDFGTVNNPFNEFLDSEYPSLAQGNWMAREAVRVLTIHQNDGELKNPTDLARAHLYLAISYIIIGDMFDDWAFSDRQTAKAPVGPANMGTETYDKAIASLTTAISIAQTAGDGALETAALAFRARAHHGRAVWNRVGQRPITTGTVATAQGAADAAAALARMGGATSNYKWQFNYSAQTVTASIGAWVNDRQEMRISQVYASPKPGAPTFDKVTFTDPINTTTVSPELERTILTWSAASDKGSLTMVSAREMQLIIAENALAGGQTATFATAINALRALDGLTAWNQTTPQVPALSLLIHHRRTDLFLQGRRLADHYRFSQPSAQWQAASVAVQAPGTFFPITVVECRANEFINDACQ